MNKKQTGTTSSNEQDYQLLEETKKLRTAKSTLYVSKKNRWEDASSTAYIFVLFGCIGDIIIVLSMLGILSLPIASTRFNQIIMLLLFTVFLMIGISSWKKAIILKSKIGEEEDTTKQINAWLEENMTKTTLDTISDTSVPEEIDYLNKLNYLKENLQQQFPDADIDYLDALADTYLTNMLDSQA